MVDPVYEFDLSQYRTLTVLPDIKVNLLFWQMYFFIAVARQCLIKQIFQDWTALFQQ